MERHFEQQIDKLRTRLIKMCSLVDEQVELAIRAVEEGNKELSALVIERDNKVDKYDVKIDKICMKLFALNQPVAMDLRLIMSALTINTNLERMGDLAVSIARSAEMFGTKPGYFGEISFQETSAAAREMVRQAIDSFVDNNPSLARKVLESDDRLDELTITGRRKLIEIMKRSSDNIETAIKLYSMYHAFERLGDHSTNIAENVYFIVEAEMIKHKYEGFIDKVDSEEEAEDDASEI